MVEGMLLVKVGMFIKAVVWGGYSIAGGYLVKTAVRYAVDYKEAVANEKTSH